MSRIEQLIDEIEEFIESCKPQPFSQSKVIVPKDELYELLTELRLKTPDEIKRYQKIIANKDKIINDAQAQAEKMLEETTAYANALVEEHEIMLKAYERAEEVMNNANAQAEATVNAANEDAENIRRGALEYTAELIDNLQTVIARTLDVARTNYDGLLGGLSYNLDILTSNREALTEQLSAPAEPIPAYEPKVVDFTAHAQTAQPEVAPIHISEDEDIEEDEEPMDMEEDDDYDDID